MPNNDTYRKPGKRTDAGVRRLVLAAFRVGTLSLALLELEFDAPETVLLPAIVIAIGAVLYTCFKLLHPFRWYQSKHGVTLIAVDVTVCALLLFMPRVIHTSFALYTLNPVLVSALLFRAGVTWITTGVTAVYYSLNFFSFPLTVSMQNLSSMFFTYLTALGLMAWIPYVVNPHVRQKLQSRVLSAERLRLGREIHDGVCQSIYGLRWELQRLRGSIDLTTPRDSERLAHLESLVDAVEEEARGSVELLRSSRVDRPLLPQIEDSLRHLESETGIGCRLETEGKEPRLDDLVKLEVLHICEEALANAARHSGAKQVVVRVHAPNGHLHVAIADNGRGIAEERLGKGHGLQVMKERAELLGGDCRVISSPGAGTEIRLEVPCRCSQELQMPGP